MKKYLFIIAFVTLFAQLAHAQSFDRDNSLPGTAFRVYCFWGSLFNDNTSNCPGARSVNVVDVQIEAPVVDIKPTTSTQAPVVRQTTVYRSLPDSSIRQAVESYVQSILPSLRGPQGEKGERGDAGQAGNSFTGIPQVFWNGAGSSGSSNPVTNITNIYSSTSSLPTPGASGTVLTINASGTPEWLPPTFSGTSSPATTTNLLSTSGTDLASTVNGVVATTSLTGLIASSTTNNIDFSTSTNILTSTVNGVVSTTSIVAITASTTNVATTSGNVITSTVNGVVATTTSVTSNILTSLANTITSTVNGIASAAANIINSFSQSLSGNVLTTTINGVSATSSVIGNNTISSSGNVLTSDVNGVTSTTTAVNSNGLSLSGTILTSSVNGVSSSTDIASAIASSTTNSLNFATSTNILTSTVNGVTSTTSIIVGTSGITLLNGEASTTQLFATSTSGTDFSITSSFGTHTFNLPSASAVNRGALTPIDWTTFNNKLTTATGTTGQIARSGDAQNPVFSLVDTGVSAGTYGSSTTIPVITVDAQGRITSASATATPFLTAASLATQAFIQDGNSFGTLATLGTNDAQDLAFETSGTERMRITTGGNVGIGTTSPSQTLTVSGTSSLRDIIPETNLTYSLGTTARRWNEAWIGTLNLGTSTWSMTQSANGRFSLFDAASGGGSERLTVLTNGNVGVGTIDPLARLHVRQDQNTDSSIRVSNVDPGAAATAGLHTVNNFGNLGIFGIGSSNHSAGGIANSTFVVDVLGNGLALSARAGAIRFYTGGTEVAGTERGRFAITGGFAVGTTSPAYGLTGDITIAGRLFVGSTTASSTFMNGINLEDGCFAVNGVCIGSGSGWSLTGNAGTNPNVNFLGTTDAQDLVFKTNNATTGRISSDGASLFFGLNAGLNSSVSAVQSNFFGAGAGNTATDAYASNFFGPDAGFEATFAYQSNFIGPSAGYQATNANTSNFIGGSAGAFASTATNSNFFGNQAGSIATNASYSNFIGDQAGFVATDASNSNFIGTSAGFGAANASNSNFLGFSAGQNATNARRSIFIGNNAGFSDSVNNSSVTASSSILIGNNTNTGGFSDSIAIGAYVLNSAARQLNIGNSIFATNIHTGTTQSATPVVGSFVGIGTSTPSEKLQVQGNLRISGSFMPGNTAGATGTVLVSQGLGVAPTWIATSSLGIIGASSSPAGANTQIQYNNSGVFGATSTFVWDNTNGRLGVGTSTPSHELSLIGNIFASSTGTSTFTGNVNVQGVLKVGTSSTYIRSQATSTFDGGINLTNGGCFAIAGVCISGGGGSGWSLTGNAGTDSNVNFLGTTDLQDLVFKTNNATTGRISATGTSVFFGLGAGTNGASQDNTIFMGFDAGNGATNAIYSLFFGNQAGSGATDAAGSNFFGETAGFGAINASNSNFFGLSAGNSATGASNSNFFGNSAGNGATDAFDSNFFGNNAGNAASAADNSNFFGPGAGSGATNAQNSNFFGSNAGNGAVFGANSNFFGINAGNGGVFATYSNFFGQNAGNGASSASYSNFLGNGAGENASSASNSNFFGDQAGNGATDASHSNFFGSNAGNGAAFALQSNFFGNQAGNTATNASNSNFFGNNAGWNATDASNSNFFGNESGYLATFASNSNFLGNQAGYGASAANNSNFIGTRAGIDNNAGEDSMSFSNCIGYEACAEAIRISHSNFIGYRAGSGSPDASNSIFVGRNAGLNDTVANFGDDWSILIGNNTNTGGFSNSIALGANALNTAANQLVVGSSTLGSAINEIYLGLNDTNTFPLLYANLTGVGIGTTTPARQLHIFSDSTDPVARFGNQNGYCEIDPTNTALVCTSDQSLKKDVEGLTLGIDVIAQLRAVTYRWNNETPTTTPHFGFIAQEVESIIPELVTTDSRTGLKSVAYTGIIPILTQAIVDLDTSLGGTATTSSTESFVSSKIWNKITSAFEWLGVTIQNGLITMKDLIADTVFAKEVETEKLCISENGEKFCISKDDLRQLKDLIGSTTSNDISTPAVEENNDTDIIPPGESAPTDPISPDPASDPLPVTEETPSDTVSDTTSPVEETTPVVEPVTESAPTGEPAPVLEP